MKEILKETFILFNKEYVLRGFIISFVIAIISDSLNIMPNLYNYVYLPIGIVVVLYLALFLAIIDIYLTSENNEK